MLLLDADRRVLLASLTARRFFAPGRPLTLVGGAISASDPRDAARLATAFASLHSGARSSRTLAMGEGPRRIELQLVSLHGERRPIEVVAHIRGLADDHAHRLASAVRRFGLTPAESHLLAVLCSGASLAQASSRLGVARTTVRTHLQRIFDKSGTHRQAELVGLVLMA